MAPTPKRTRPVPPDALLVDPTQLSFAPAHDVLTWISEQILSEDGPLHNEEHQHLVSADLAVLWASGGFSSRQKRVVGQAEEVLFRCGAWQRGRQEQQMREWFGRVPRWLITLDASYSATCSDADWCALVEHELYHIAHLRDAFGAPVFSKDGRPKIVIRAHDVEEFEGVVRRYGVGDPNGAIARLANAARAGPQVSRAGIAGACGTCLLRVA